jgi:hypothetical protein
MKRKYKFLRDSPSNNTNNKPVSGIAFTVGYIVVCIFYCYRYSCRGGGSYVSESLNIDMVEPLMALLQEQPESRYDVLEVRHALEGMAAYYAALRATDDDRELIKQRFEEMIAAQDHMVFVEESLQHIDQEQARKERSLRKISLIKNGI